jgi:hypothetical protein
LSVFIADRGNGVISFTFLCNSFIDILALWGGMSSLLKTWHCARDFVKRRPLATFVVAGVMMGEAPVALEYASGLELPSAVTSFTDAALMACVVAEVGICLWKAGRAVAKQVSRLIR